MFCTSGTIIHLNFVCFTFTQNERVNDNFLFVFPEHVSYGLAYFRVGTEHSLIGCDRDVGPNRKRNQNDHDIRKKILKRKSELWQLAYNKYYFWIRFRAFCNNNRTENQPPVNLALYFWDLKLVAVHKFGCISNCLSSKVAVVKISSPLNKGV